MLYSQSNTPSAPQAAKPEPSMPADLKKVAREICSLCGILMDNSATIEAVESRLSEVRAQALEEAAKICDESYKSRNLGDRSPRHLASAIRRRASGKDE
jgi:hypothetical protein